MMKPDRDTDAGHAGERVLHLLFCTSGAVALSAEVVLERLLTYVFGASHLATATVLAAYMAGLSLGTIAVGRLTPRLRRPIAAYGYFELGVGLFLALTPSLYTLLDGPGLALARAWAGHGAALTAARFVFAFLFVLVPTVLMGGTLPLLAAASAGTSGLRLRLPSLYAVNTLGAAAGTLLATYVLLPRLGHDGTLFAGALANAVVGLTALGISGAEGQARAPGRLLPSPPTVPPTGVPLTWACSLAWAQGVVVFVLEVTWAHLIGTVIGVTVYAFGLMLTAILLGIGLGSLGARQLGRRGMTPATVAAAGQLAAALGIALSLFAWDRFPQVVELTLRLRPDWPFAAREAVRFAFALPLLLPATVGFGAALPMLAASAGVQAERGAGSSVGLVFGANTLGAIVGSLLCGFLLLGSVSSERILVAAAIATLALGLALHGTQIRSTPIHGRRALDLAFAAAAVLAAGLTLAFPGWNAARLTAGSHYYWTPAASPAPPILSMREDSQAGFVTVEREPDGVLVVKTNGKYEGSGRALEFQDHLATFGALYLKRFRRAALVGLGPGRTLALLHELPFERIELVEYSKAMVDTALLYFPQFAAAPLRDSSRVTLALADGRDHLQSSTSRYDYVAIAITGAAFAGVGSLYTADFFRTVRDHLEPGGVFLLWVQLHHVRPHDVRSVVLTLSRAFPHVQLYATPDGGQGYLVASGSPLTIDPGVVARLERAPRIRAIMAATGMRSLLELTALNVFSTPEEIAAFAAGLGAGGPRPEVFTDFRPGFEYGTPYGLAEPNPDHRLQQLSRRWLPRFEPALDDAELARLAGLRRYVADTALATSAP